jgi:hypothetical protein
MEHKKIIVTMIAGAVVMSANPLWAATTTQDRTQQKIQTQTKEQERIYGSQLMTEKERTEYRERMRSGKREQEREKIRAEHHDRMVDAGWGRALEERAMAVARGPALAAAKAAARDAERTRATGWEG